MLESTQNSTAIGQRCEIHALEEKLSKKGEMAIVPQGSYRPVDSDPNAGYALVVKRVFTADGSLTKVVLSINSPQILSALKAICGDNHSHPSSFDVPLAMDSPFIDLYHYWEQIDEYQTRTEDDTQRMHLDLLLTFMRSEMGQERVQALDMINRGFMMFMKLWTLFRPGTILFKKEQGHPWIMKLEKTAYEESTKTGRRFEVHFSHTIQSGDGLKQYHGDVHIFEKMSFGGDTPCKITALPIYPFRFVTDQSLELELEKRGEKCEHLTGMLNMHYSGQAKYQRSPPKLFYDPDMTEFPLVWLPFAETARVVIDAGTFLDEFGKARESLISHTSQGFQSWAIATYGDYKRASRILCAPYVWGFSLQRKQWCRYHVRNLNPIEWNTNLMHELVLPQKPKSLLKALVTTHKFPSANAGEESYQKGKGLVILLHGTPGSGKTLSAEASAEVSRSALIKISLGELYSQFGRFEEETLRTLLQYATIWKAIVLIDEADVFLEARTSGTGEAAQRNGLVATFLKYLEYFSGIVFLTSNRVENFDPAMKSRIHLALQFSSPSVDTRREIWSKEILRIPYEERELEIQDSGINGSLDTLIGEEMNGREISNSINTAQTFARSTGEKLKLEHLEMVVDAWKEFSLSLLQLGIEQERRPRRDTIVSNALEARRDSQVITTSDASKDVNGRWLP